MNIEYNQRGSSTVAVCSGEGVLLGTVGDAMDIIASAGFEKHCTKIVIDRDSITPSFFDLKTGMAGEVLQKFTNYRIRFAIVGDFSYESSKSLRDFIYECNQGNQVLFVDSLETALDRLHGV